MTSRPLAVGLAVAWCVASALAITVDAAALPQYFSVCESSAPMPAAPAPVSILPIPVIDAATSAQPLELRVGEDCSCVAWGFFNDDIATTGWSYFSVITNPRYTDHLQSRAAGFLEGYLTQQRIGQYIATQLPSFYPNGGVPSPGVAAWLNETLNFKVGMMTNVAAVDPYWSQVANLYLQVQGVWEGYNAAALVNGVSGMSWFEIYSLQLDVDISDITTAVGLHSPLATPEERAAAQATIDARRRSSRVSATESHCSSLVKLLPQKADLLISHDTWSHFSTMLRVFKVYDMPLSVSKAFITHESSYPGYLFSSDDWYQNTNADNSILLTVTETSNNIYNPELYAAIQPGSVATWARTIIANRMATDGPSWVEVFSRFNSGTCGNQWIIVDHNRFQAWSKAPLMSGLLTVTEQMPGAFATGDLTAQLERDTYYSSFNIPIFNLTYHVSGYDTGCPGGAFECVRDESYRYLLFQQQQANVVDLASMQNVAMYNEWQTNPLQRKRARYAIAARFDLDADRPEAYGGLDAKITKDSWMKAGALRVSAKSGPTTQTQAPFCWSQMKQPPPPGQPDCFDFEWVQFAFPLDAATTNSGAIAQA